MRYLIISDIHANLIALEAVLADAEGQWDDVWFLGDLVGYGPDPNGCVARLRQLEAVALSGNHDWAVLDRLDLSTFNDDAQAAIRWTQRQLTDESYDYLETLPPRIDLDLFTLAHGSPRRPVWEYILDIPTANANFPYFDTPYCLVGHTHLPVVYEQGEDEVTAHLPNYEQPLQLDESRLIINPGSVGQPRDFDARAAYALLDTELMTLSHRRVSYDVEATQRRMSQLDMPYRLITRLYYGW